MGNTLNTYGKPVISATPTQTVVDMQAIADFADAFANVRRGLASERGSLTAGQVRDGMLFLESDTGRGYQRRSGAWALVIGSLSARMKRSNVAKSITNTTINQDLSANNLWVQDWRDSGIAAYNNGWTIPVTGDWQVEIGGQFSEAVDLYISVNKSSVATFADVSGYAQGFKSAAAVALPQASKALRLNAGDVVRLFGASLPASAAWDNTYPNQSWFGIRFIRYFCHYGNWRKS